MTHIPCKVRVFSVMLLLLVLLSSCTSLPESTLEKTYTVGDTGPANGLIFFDKGEYLDGWRYLEVAPAKTEVTLQWGSFDSLVGDTSPVLGKGKDNTSLIVASQANNGQRDHAAKYCDDLSLNGYDDWYLPSREELDLLFWQLASKDIGEFKKLGFGYWSSSEYDQAKAWGQGFSEGVQGRIEKTALFLARPIRSF
ncbi:MAG: DUF1566 domain-containing protein [Sphaerochaeta sp.]|nr:DUF1566 domain-containing protein [Sphaerochaeta sp.]